ncbi:MAG: alpha-amylase [Cytophagia bacterium]|nr:alpha-amylase [Cytophagia bacterium]
MTKNIFFKISAIVLVLAGCAQPKEKISPPMENQATQKVVVYQLMTRLFANTNTTNKPFGSIEENGVGKFNDINNEALQSLKALGITHVWYTGVLEHATMTDYTSFGIKKDDPDVIKGRAGSPYAIKDYYDVDPDLAVDVKNRMKEFEQLVDRTHQNGLKLIIDFIPNHVARSYQSDAKPANVRDLGEDDDKRVAFKATNNFYYLPGESFRVPEESQAMAKTLYPGKDGRYEEIPAKVTGNDQFTSSPGINEWFETVKLNYGVDVQNGKANYFDPIPNTWEKMRDILVFWAGKKVDGFRCDVAEMVPVEFWNWVIPQVKAVNADIIFIAEIYNPAAYSNYISNGRFDYLYEKVKLYDTLRLMLDKKRSTLDIDAIQQSLSGINRHMLHFLENHDEQRLASPFFAGNAFRALPAMTISATLDAGPVMIYFGQEVGEPGKGAEGFSQEDGRTTIFDYWGVPEHQKWVNGGKFNDSLLSDGQKTLRKYYSTLLNLAKNNQAITAGAYADLTAFNIQKANFGEDVHAFVRYTDTEKLLIINSFNDVPAKVKVELPKEIFEALQLDPENKIKLQDVLWGTQQLEIEAGAFELMLKPYSTFIFKMQ